MKKLHSKFNKIVRNNYWLFFSIGSILTYFPFNKLSLISQKTSIIIEFSGIFILLIIIIEQIINMIKPNNWGTNG
jgi:hypothetical protein